MSFHRNNWIGRKNLMGYLRFWWYEHQGWTFGGGMYYHKPHGRKHWWSKI